MKRAVLYSRVSADDRSKEGRNLASQLEMGQAYAQGKGYQVVAQPTNDTGDSFSGQVGQKSSARRT